MKRVLTFLQEPYPQREDERTILLNSLLSGGIIFFILIVFRPFGFAGVEFPVALKLSSWFGAMSVLVVFCYELFLKYVLRLQRDRPEWTFGKWLLSMLGLVGCITIVNYFFTVYSYRLPHSWGHMGLIFINTVGVGIVPIGFFGALNVTRSIRIHEKVAGELELGGPEIATAEAPGPVRLPVHQSAKYFEIDPQKILYIEAMQNYVRVHYEEEGVVCKEVLRNTISRMEEALDKTSLVRCHRSFLVNTSRIRCISGNAQGLKLELQPSPGFGVPVSRKYIPFFKKENGLSVVPAP